MADPETSDNPNNNSQGDTQASATAEREEQSVDAERPSGVESADGEADGEEETDEAEQEEEGGECGFCLFMKSGPCRESFVKWEECVEQAEKEKEDIVDKCHKVTFLLKECMEQNSDYYEPVLQAERAMSEEAESEVADTPRNEGEEELNPTTAESNEQPSLTPSQSQHLPESEKSSAPVPENSPSE